MSGGGPAFRRGAASTPAGAAAGAILSAAVLSCAEAPPSLVGEWVSVGSERPGMTYVFEEGGVSRWVLDLPDGPDTFAVPYLLDHGAAPMRLDVGPWPAGPLEGRTLFGIVEMTGPDRFRVDFEPSDPEGGEADRPRGFSEQAVTFVRRQN